MARAEQQVRKEVPNNEDRQDAYQKDGERCGGDEGAKAQRNERTLPTAGGKATGRAADSVVRRRELSSP